MLGSISDNFTAELIRRPRPQQHELAHPAGSRPTNTPRHRERKERARVTGPSVYGPFGVVSASQKEDNHTI